MKKSKFLPAINPEWFCHSQVAFGFLALKSLILATLDCGFHEDGDGQRVANPRGILPNIVYIATPLVQIMSSIFFP